MYTSGQMLEKCPKNYHFFPLFGAPGGTARCQSSIGKSFRAKQIGPDRWCSGAVKIPRGMRKPQKTAISMYAMFTTSSGRQLSVLSTQLSVRIALELEAVTVISARAENR